MRIVRLQRNARKTLGISQHAAGKSGVFREAVNLEDRAAGFLARHLRFCYPDFRGSRGAREHLAQPDHLKHILHLPRRLDDRERAIHRGELFVDPDQRANSGGADVSSFGKIEPERMDAFPHHLACRGGEVLCPIPIQPAFEQEFQMAFVLAA